MNEISESLLRKAERSIAAAEKLATITKLRIPVYSASLFPHEIVCESEKQRGFFPARKPTAKDLKDVKEHENDPIEPKDHDTMDDAVEDL
jgi:hypothetical protein